MYQDLTGEPKRVRLVLERTVTRQDVIRHSVAARWLGQGVQEHAPGKMFQYSWRTEGGDARINYVEDEAFGFAYFSARSDSAEALERLAAAIRADAETVPTIGDDVVRRQFEAAFGADGTHNDRLDAVYLVGLTSPAVAAPDWMRCYEAAAADPDSDVRRAALWAMSQAEWPEFRPLALSLKDDPDAEVRATAADVGELLEKKHGAQEPAASAF